MLEVGLGHYLTVAAILFTLGLVGIFLNKKNVIVILMSIELILLSVNINLVAFATELGDLVGQMFAMFVLTVAAAEAAIGLAILVTYYRNRGTIDVDDVTGKRVEDIEPFEITRSHELQDSAVDDVELVVVVRDDGARTVVVGFFMIGPNIAEVSPPILVDDFTLCEKALVAVNRST